MQIKLFKIFLTKVLHLASFLKWEFLELENVLQEMTATFSFEESYKPHDITHVDCLPKNHVEIGIPAAHNL